MKIITLLLFILFLSLSDTYSQEYKVSEELFLLLEQKPVKTDYKKYLRENDNEFKIIFSFFFLAYKEFISSQDQDVCNFYPSCSAYMIESIKQKGVFEGLLNGFDRLTRCNPFISEKDYPVHQKTMKYYDPVE